MGSMDWISSFTQGPSLSPDLTDNTPPQPHRTQCKGKGNVFWDYRIKLLWEHPTNNNNMFYKFLFLLEGLQVKLYNWILVLAIFQLCMEKYTDTKVDLKDTRGVTSTLGQIEFSSHFVELFRRFVMAFHRQKSSKTYCIEPAEHFFSQQTNLQ